MAVTPSFRHWSLVLCWSLDWSLVILLPHHLRRKLGRLAPAGPAKVIGFSLVAIQRDVHAAGFFQAFEHPTLQFLNPPLLARRIDQIVRLVRIRLDVV